MYFTKMHPVNTHRYNTNQHRVTLKKENSTFDTTKKNKKQKTRKKVNHQRAGHGLDEEKKVTMGSRF